MWCWMMAERAFLDNALQGIIISISFAFLVLLVATFNVIQAAVSILCIVFIVSSVISIMVFCGWELGVAESVAVVILIGFSVDYVVHLAAHYIHSAHSHRHQRIQEALQEMGISIFSGAVTTFGSGLFLFFATITVFFKFAILIISTITFSLIYSMLFFTSLMHICGPQGHTGSLGFVFNFCNKCRKKEGSKEQE